MKNSDETCVIIDDIYIVVTTGNLYTYQRRLNFDKYSLRRKYLTYTHLY
jgi:hypothetical protein